MRVRLSSPQPLANVLPGDMKASSPASDVLPGLIVNTDVIAAHDPALHRRMLDSPLAPRAGTAHFVVVRPHELPFLVQHDSELALFKTILKTATHDRPVIGRVIDTMWIVYGAYKLREMARAGASASACFWQLGDLAASTAAVTGQFVPSMKLPDAFANGMNYVVAAGGALSEGRAIPFTEIALSQDERNALPLAAMKALGLSLDNPSTIGPAWLRPKISALGTAT
jgi:hypothetical protein